MLKEEEESKYFTPDIEDISVGCEFEMDNTWGGWTKLTLTKELLSNPMVSLGSGNERNPWYWKFRVPYLTKKQIENEGFEQYAKSIDSWFKFKESPITHTKLQDFHRYKPYNLYLNYGYHDHRLKIKCDFYGTDDFDKSDTLYEGECRDINTFRKIMKLLNIQ